MKLESIKFYKIVKELDSQPWNRRALIRIEQDTGNTEVSLFSWDSFSSVVSTQGVSVNKIAYSHELLVQTSDGSEIIMRFEEGSIDLPGALARLGYIQA